MTARTPSRTFPLWLALLLALVCGAGVALQSRINGELGKRLGDGFAAAAISFGSGLVILLIALAVAPAGRRGLRRVRDALRGGELRWWYVCGGAAGAFLVLSQGLVAAVLGVALFTVSVVAGQTVSGLVLDRIGLGPGGRRPLTPSRVVGAGIALVAVLWAVSAQLGGSISVWAMVLPLLAGLGMGWQQAVNGQVRVLAESALTATFINFLVGTVVLVVLMLVHFAFAGLPRPLPSELWLYLGGAIGCVFIAANALLVRITGVLLLGLATVAGQLITALLLDLLLPSSQAGVPFSTIGGTLLAVVAVGVASIRWGRRRRTAGEL
ncbi:DMT family transporter [Leifsonia sp. F6_8S_P_1B]|uniref:DMT family transporter n=1 Tax=Leifsonia williamsii TaxID=3035919 RepID=A0ABT8KHR6_9MICO|nr:DMT family transporter [Leifsonia williamsii]MDN4615992.1 DMT family transporter [Leifsonia williamsii]